MQDEKSVGADAKRLTEIVTADLHGVRGTVTEIIKGDVCILMDLKPTETHTNI